ncbi:MAG: hypothetical protein WDO68_02160 [Gammaproteobacteria bacterium]
MAKVNVVLPGAAERELALSAAPEPLRAGATVYVFGKNGFEKARAGSNGFTCLVNRDAFIYGASHLKPTCWDAAGATTYVPVMLKLGELLARGASADAIRAAIDAGFADHTFNPPRTGGVAYMLAGDVEVDASTGEVTRQLFPGHFMFYVNGVTNEQLGYVAGATHAQNLPHVFSDGAGGNHGLAYVIVVAAKPEQDGASKAADRMRH